MCMQNILLPSLLSNALPSKYYCRITYVNDIVTSLHKCINIIKY